jgi:hypothetical protein
MRSLTSRRLYKIAHQASPYSNEPTTRKLVYRPYSQTMLIENAPDFVLKKLLAWERQEREIEAKRAALRGHISECQKILRQGFDKPGQNYDDVEAELASLRAKLAAIPSRGNPGGAYERCRKWIEGLPEGATLEPIVVKLAEGMTLAELRERISKSEANSPHCKACPCRAPTLRNGLTDTSATWRRPRNRLCAALAKAKSFRSLGPTRLLVAASISVPQYRSRLVPSPTRADDSIRRGRIEFFSPEIWTAYERLQFPRKVWACPDRPSSPNSGQPP